MDTIVFVLQVILFVLRHFDAAPDKTDEGVWDDSNSVLLVYKEFRAGGVEDDPLNGVYEKAHLHVIYSMKVEIIDGRSRTMENDDGTDTTVGTVRFHRTVTSEVRCGVCFLYRSIRWNYVDDLLYQVRKDKDGNVLDMKVIGEERVGEKELLFLPNPDWT